jgi:hypothetical protein
LASDVAAGQLTQHPLQLEPDDAGTRHPPGEAQRGRADAGADVQHHLARLGQHGGRQQHRVDGDAIALARLTQLDPAVQQRVVGHDRLPLPACLPAFPGGLVTGGAGPSLVSGRPSSRLVNRRRPVLQAGGRFSARRAARGRRSRTHHQPAAARRRCCPSIRLACPSSTTAPMPASDSSAVSHRGDDGAEASSPLPSFS